MKKIAIIAGLLAATAVSSVQAQGIELDEFRAGFFIHNAYTGFLPTGDNWDLTRLEDIKVAALFDMPDIAFLDYIGSPRFELGATFNVYGKEHLAHANLNWQIPVFDTPLYLELGFGAAVTTGALQGATHPDRNFGCAVNFYDAIGIGYNLSDKVTATLRYEHISNLDMCSSNDGLSNLGFMLGYKF